MSLRPLSGLRVRPAQVQEGGQVPAFIRPPYVTLRKDLPETCYLHMKNRTPFFTINIDFLKRKRMVLDFNRSSESFLTLIKFKS